jgi:aspartate-semialdehyde dehydrogenase
MDGCSRSLHQSAQNDKIRVVMKAYHIAVVGATGATGTELLRVLERRNFPVASLRAIGSSRSVGKSVRFREESVPIDHSTKSISPFSAQAATFPEIMFRLPASRTRSRLINHRRFEWIRMCRS